MMNIERYQEKVHGTRELIDCYAPHMGITAKISKETKKFYQDLDVLLKSLKGTDIINLGDFNVKLGCMKRDPWVLSQE